MNHALLAAFCGATALAVALVPGAAKAQAKGSTATPVVKVRVVADRHVVVDQHPIVVLKTDSRGKVIWELPAQGPWRFQSDSVAIDGGQFLGCNVEAKGMRYVCTDKSPRQSALFPYRITVYNGTGGNAKGISTDSAVQNE